MAKEPYLNALHDMRRFTRGFGAKAGRSAVAQNNFGMAASQDERCLILDKTEITENDKTKFILAGVYELGKRADCSIEFNYV